MAPSDQLQYYLSQKESGSFAKSNDLDGAIEPWHLLKKETSRLISKRWICTCKFKVKRFNRVCTSHYIVSIEEIVSSTSLW